MKKNKFKLIELSKKKFSYNYDKKIIINDLILKILLGYYDFEKIKKQKVKFNLEISFTNQRLTNDKDIKKIVNYENAINIISKLVKKKHYNFLETLAEYIFDKLFVDNRVDKVLLRIEKLEIIKKTKSVGIEIIKSRRYD
jgi:dihydroneopterin aldolase